MTEPNRVTRLNLARGFLASGVFFAVWGAIVALTDYAQATLYLLIAACVLVVAYLVKPTRSQP